MPATASTAIDTPRLTHLKQLEAESIHIIREVAAEFENPVMLFSLGKDSMVMFWLALKAFYPAKLPFPLLHVDTTWKFREMYQFRDWIAERVSASNCSSTSTRKASKTTCPLLPSARRNTPTS